MINKIWTILNRGSVPSSPFGRRTTASLYSEENPNRHVLDVLNPLTLSTIEAQFRIEQAVQLVLRSILRADALAFDPVNTYEKAALTYPSEGFADDSQYELTYSGQASAYFSKECVLTSTEFTVDGQTVSYSTTNTLSESLEIANGVTIRVRGPVTGTDTFQIIYMPALQVPWNSLIKELEQLEIDWPRKELRTVWLHDYLWLNRIAAIVMAIAEGNDATTESH